MTHQTNECNHYYHLDDDLVCSKCGAVRLPEVLQTAESTLEHGRSPDNPFSAIAIETRELLAMADRAIMWECEPSLGREFQDRVEAVLGTGGVEPHVHVKENS